MSSWIVRRDSKSEQENWMGQKAFTVLSWKSALGSMRPQRSSIVVLYTIYIYSSHVLRLHRTADERSAGVRARRRLFTAQIKVVKRIRSRLCLDLVEHTGGAFLPSCTLLSRRGGYTFRLSLPPLLCWWTVWNTLSLSLGFKWPGYFSKQSSCVLFVSLFLENLLISNIKMFIIIVLF